MFISILGPLGRALDHGTGTGTMGPGPGPMGPGPGPMGPGPMGPGPGPGPL